MTTEKTVNYTAEQTAKMVSEYTANPTRETVENLANVMGKTVKSIVAKLSREKVYIKAEYKTKSGESVQKKDETADAIGLVLKMTEGEIESLTKANKTALAKIWKLICESKPAVE